jgi:selenocysteine-specific elongation factor
MIIGTAGHIDHGKTALVKALTGVDADRLPEEKRRGITIDLGFAPLSLEGVGTVGVIDVPGHEDFVRSMLVGASGIDLGLLVVAADEGIMPQTREHLQILYLLRIPRIVVALTKSDLVDDEWLGLVRAEVVAMFEQLKLAIPPVAACSSRTGEGLPELRLLLSESLSRGVSRPGDDVFRMPVDRAFTIRGTGTVVTGTVWSGEVALDATVIILPFGKKARIRKIEQHGKTAATAQAGARTAIALAGVELTEVERGSVVVTDDAWRPTSLLEAVVSIDASVGAHLTPRTELRLHAGAAEVGARLVSAQRESLAGSAALVRITTDAPLVVRGGERFVLRLPAPVRTIGGGIVIDPYARRRPLPQQVHNLEGLCTTAASRLEFMLAAAGERGIRESDIPVRVGCVPGEVDDLIERSGSYRGGHNLFAPVAVEQVMATVRRIVAEYEIKSPLALGVPARTLREGLRVDEELADIAIREMERDGAIESYGPLIRRSGWAPTPTAHDLEASTRLAHDICAAEHEPPSVGELVSRYGSSVPALLRFLERQGRIVQVETDRYYDRGTLETMTAKLKSELVPGKVYVPAQLRDVLGFSRKFLIPFLEYCDRKGITERRGDGRVLRETTGVLLDTSRAHS